MQPNFKFTMDGDEKEYSLVRGKDSNVVVWFDRGRRREILISDSQLEHKLNTKAWNVFWRVGEEIEKEMENMNYDVKNSYLITIHHFLQEMRNDDFFFDNQPNLDVLTICLGQDDALRGKVQRVLEEHLRDEVAYHGTVRGT